MSDRDVMQQALEALERARPQIRGVLPSQDADAAITALRACLAKPEPEPVAEAWSEGYRQGVHDERTSEENRGIAGFGAKVEPARQNPYRAAPPTRRSEPEPERNREWHDGLLEGRLRERQYWLAGCCMNTTPPARQPLTDEEIDHIADSVNPATPLQIGKRLFARAIERAHGITGGNDE